ncbi:hypothetical protein [Aquirufa rosea]|uniref:Uncharacterized protein n=1 Tax=Aquirufa rosea TaxID=2509241 RepID=A0A4V1M5S0_9BACT|nr:hypothetical protein [Aquirufa rosea]RXK52382.1 hypothetical protein ESB04_01660 [Aquirufa rosea]
MKQVLGIKSEIAVDHTIKVEKTESKDFGFFDFFMEESLDSTEEEEDGEITHFDFGFFSEGNQCLFSFSGFLANFPKANVRYKNYSASIIPFFIRFRNIRL